MLPVLLALAGCQRSKVLIPPLGEVYTDYPDVELRIEAVEQNEGTLTLNPGGQIYEITASWIWDVLVYGGEVIYYFYGVQHTVNDRQGET